MLRRTRWLAVPALTALTALGLAVAPAQAAPGDLDTTLAGGIFTAAFTTTFPGSEDSQGVAVDSQGRVYLSATEESSVGGNSAVGIKVVRLSALGVPDSGFGSGGTVTLPTTGSVRHAGIVVDAQDRPLILGYTGAATGTYQILLTRLTTGGLPDPDFGGGDGVVETGLPGAAGVARPEGIGLTPSGQILVAGTYIQGFARGFITRFDSTGAPDTGYGTGGWTEIADSGAQAVALHVIAGGAAFVGGWDDYKEWFVAKITPGGALDTAFDGDGLARSGVGLVGTEIATSYGLTVDAQERPILVGQHTSSVAKLTVMRWTAGGAPDSGFGTGTPTTGALFMPGAPNSRGVDAAVCDGKVLVAGTASRLPPANGNGVVVGRLLDNGALDTSFAPAAATPGVASVTSGDNNGIQDLALTSAGIYIAGMRTLNDGTYTILAQVARLSGGASCGGGGGEPPVTPPVAPPVTPPATPAATPPTPAKPAAAALPVFSKLVTLPSTKKCVSRRKFSIRLKVPRGSSVVEATVRVNGKRAAVRRGSRLRSTVDLRNLPKGRFRVEVVLKLADGRNVKDIRRYFTCTAKKKRR